MPGDSIVVKEQTGTINVVGEVYNPGLIEFEKGRNQLELILTMQEELPDWK